jgi:hypothetical protein
MFQQYYDEQATFQWNDDVRFIHVLHQHAKLDFLVLSRWHNSQQIDMSLQSDTLSWFQANRSLLLLLTAACLVEKQQIPILVFCLTLLGFELTIYPIQSMHTNHYSTDVIDLHRQKLIWPQ